MYSDGRHGCSDASLWQGEPPPGLDLPTARQPSSASAAGSSAGTVGRGTVGRDNVAAREGRAADAQRPSTVTGSSAGAKDSHRRPPASGDAGEGYQQVPFAYAAPAEQGHAAERRLRDDASQPGLLGHSGPPEPEQAPQREDEGTGHGNALFRFLAGTASEAAPAEDPGDSRRRKKKERHKERKRIKKGDRERRRSRSARSSEAPAASEQLEGQQRVSADEDDVSTPAGVRCSTRCRRQGRLGPTSCPQEFKLGRGT